MKCIKCGMEIEHALFCPYCGTDNRITTDTDILVRLVTDAKNGNADAVNDYAMQYLGVKKAKKLPKAMLRAAWGSTARIAVAPLQDFLNAPPSARINTPSTLGGNWVFRTRKSDYSAKLKAYIRSLNETYGRLNVPADEPENKR